VFPRAVASAINSLESLHLEHNRLSDAIARSRRSRPRRGRLDLSHNAIGIRELEELTGATWFSRLVK